MIGGGKPPAVEQIRQSAAVQLQLLDIVVQGVGMGIEQGPTQVSAPSFPRPIVTPLNNRKPRELDVDDLSSDFG